MRLAAAPQRRPVLLALAVLLAWLAVPTNRVSAEDVQACGGNQTHSDYGEILVATPKIWQYERVAVLLDGMLRDLEAVSVKDLTNLNPNEANAAAIRFLQTVIEAGVSFDQGAGVRNRALVENHELQRPQQLARLESHAAYVQTLTEQRNRLAAEHSAVTNTVNKLEQAKTEGNLDEDGKKRLQAETETRNRLKAQLDEVNTLLGDAGKAPTLTVPELAANNPQLPTAPGTSLSTLAELLTNVPGLKDSLSTALKSPTHPPTRQLQNFMTLLHERMAAEITVLQDDLIRDPRQVPFLLQFDVSVSPSKKASNQVARVEFKLVECNGCRVYTIYPGQSAYNVANYEGVSKRWALWAGLSTITGFGANGAYKRQEDKLQGSLVESVYTMGFIDANRSFGWSYGPAPFERLVNAGVKSTFAIVSVPRSELKDWTNKIAFAATSSWRKRDEPTRAKFQAPSCMVETPLPGTDAFDALPAVVTEDPTRLHVMRLEYTPVYGADPGTSAPNDPLSACPRQGCAAVLITLDQPIDPNLVVSVRGRPLRRVRDWRGRATSSLPPAQIGATGLPADNSRVFRASSPGLTELDGLAADSWFAVNSRELLLNLSRNLAGEEFPSISLSDPAKRTLVVPNDLRQEYTEIVINGFRLVPRSQKQLRGYVARTFYSSYNPAMDVPAASDASTVPLMTGPYPFSTYLPLFLPERPLRRLYAFFGESGDDLLIGTQTSVAAAAPVRWLAARTQVIIEDPDLDFAWSLSCVPQGAHLSCALPRKAISDTYREMANACAGSRCPALEAALPVIRDAKLIQNLHVWVEQFDPEEDQAFGSHEPVTMPPLRMAPASLVGYRSWAFADYVRVGGTAPADRIAIRACEYFTAPASEITARLLGGFEPLPALQSSGGCVILSLPASTLARTHSVLHFAYSVPPPVPSQAGPFTPVSFSVALLNELLRPSFGTPSVATARTPVTGSGAAVQIDRWVVDIPVRRTSCHMRTSLPSALQAEWIGGNLSVRDDRQGPDTEATCASWRQADDAGELRLRVTVGRASVADVPASATLRSRAAGSVLAALPDLRRTLLPVRLTYEPMGLMQFALKGSGAEVIDAVALQLGSESWKFAVSGGAEYAFVTLTTKTSLERDKDGKPIDPATLADGQYTIRPLVLIDAATQRYLPLDTANDQGKPLIFTKAKKSENQAQGGSGSAGAPGTTTTTTKSETTEKTTKTGSGG